MPTLVWQYTDTTKIPCSIKNNSTKYTYEMAENVTQINRERTSMETKGKARGEPETFVPQTNKLHGP
jgi:hypothetical protein